MKNNDAQKLRRLAEKWIAYCRQRGIIAATAFDSDEAGILANFASSPDVRELLTKCPQMQGDENR